MGHPDRSAAANREGWRLRVAWRRPSAVTSHPVTPRAGHEPRQGGKFDNPGTLRALGVRSPLPRPKKGTRVFGFGTLEAVVGVHFRVEGWGLGAGEFPHIPSAVGGAWLWQRLRGSVPRGRVGQASEGEEPPPRKAGGPSSRPAPRLRVTRRVPLRAGFAPALAGR